MGSQAEARDEITVLVTGFGVCIDLLARPAIAPRLRVLDPFREHYPVNPSWEIARGLPSHLPPLRAKDPGARQAPGDTPGVRILVHPGPIRVNYKVVRELVPSLWDSTHGGDEATGAAPRKVDVVVHIGMAGERPVYQIERRGHRTGYKSPDVDGEKLADECGDEQTSHGPDWIWYGLPDELETDLDMPDILDRWQQHSAKNLDLRISDDPGRYLCDFIYYSSLAHLWKQQRPRKVVFLHVPADASEGAVATGRELATNLIRSIVESEVLAERRQKEKPTAAGGEL
ncbi:Pyroglutamyl-peptidase 1 [Paramyrothecium foliicola]|nr:Pyroglutamyl-peptidase 1 [Paramyrothecium foliicola]